MNKDEVMSLWTKYIRTGGWESLFTWDQMMSELDNELARQWDDQQEWMNI